MCQGCVDFGRDVRCGGLISGLVTNAAAWVESIGQPITRRGSCPAPPRSRSCLHKVRGLGYRYLGHNRFGAFPGGHPWLPASHDETGAAGSSLPARGISSFTWLVMRCPWAWATLGPFDPGLQGSVPGAWGAKFCWRVATGERQISGGSVALPPLSPAVGLRKPGAGRGSRQHDYRQHAIAYLAIRRLH